MSQGWIKLHRSMIDWEWYTDQNTSRLFIHCLIRANHSDAKWRGNDIKRGQFITSLETLSCETGLTISQVRTALKKLDDTNEIASLSQARSRVITVVKYDQYQSDDKLIASSSQADRKLIATDKNVKNVKNDNKKDIGAKAPAQKSKFIKPTPEEIHTYLLTKNIDDTAEAEKIFDYYESKGWVVGKAPMKDWKATVRNWIKNYKKPAFGNNQPSQEGATFRQYVHVKTERTPPPAGMLEELGKLL